GENRVASSAHDHLHTLQRIRQREQAETAPQPADTPAPVSPPTPAPQPATAPEPPATPAQARPESGAFGDSYVP
ncbi:MAG TPA: hypothetical protein VLQ80_17315, partial [Candidatus Saccharimonadia bacterium]|nr:hypothetical protein [Candidatus Saccharimonadia bacterium]